MAPAARQVPQNDLNAKLSANNLQATVDGTGAINITTTNDAASSTIGAVGVTATGVASHSPV